MKKLKRFDVLVVYSAYTAASAASKTKSYKTPFAGLGAKNDLDHAYAYFLTACRQRKLTAALTTSADIIGPGQCRSYWLFKSSNWTKVKQPASAAVIFDKFSPCNRRQKHQRELMFSSPAIRPARRPGARRARPTCRPAPSSTTATSTASSGASRSSSGPSPSRPTS